nr:MAG: hypothetical protein [Microviridae sp.]
MFRRSFRSARRGGSHRFSRRPVSKGRSLSHFKHHRSMKKMNFPRVSRGGFRL